MDHELSVEKIKSQLELINLSLDELREARKELKPAAWSKDISDAMDRMIEAKSRELTNNAIRDRLCSTNLSLEDLITTKAFALVAGADTDVIDGLSDAIKTLEESQLNQ